MEDMPSIEEQTIAERYVMERELFRPSITIKRAVINVILYIVITLAVAFATYYLLSMLGFFSILPKKTVAYRKRHKIAFAVWYILIIYFITGIFTVRRAVIGMIHLYQHYADEEIRRRCLFKPTCSEYAILAIKKYGLIIGGIKAYRRLFKRCRGNIYRIDYP